MSQERQDEFADWGAKLGEPEALQGQGLADKEAAWDVLHSRLQRSPGSHRSTWYAGLPKTFRRRLAAACILLVLTTAVLLLKDRSRNFPATSSGLSGRPATTRVHRENKTSPASTQPVTSVPVIVAPVTPAAALPALSSHKQSRRLIVNPVSGNPLRRDRSAGKTSLVSIAAEPDPITIAAPPLPVSIASGSKPSGIISPQGEPSLASHAKKELKVISINEIPSPVQVPALAGKKSRTPNFRIGLSPFIPLQPATATQRSEKAGFIIKLSSQNP